jgi:hypothetical protein
MKSPSTIEIKQNGSNIERHVVFARSRFELSGSSNPGTATIVVRDDDQTLWFTTGDQITLDVDSKRLWGGIVTNKAMGFFFPVQDTTDPSSVVRMWTLTCTDFSIWMKKRVLHNPSDELHQPQGGPDRIGVVIKQAMADFMDEVPGLDFTTYVVNSDVVFDDGNGHQAPIGNGFGEYWDKVLDNMALQGPFYWRVDADFNLHFDTIYNAFANWLFSDRGKTATSIGFREGTISEEGSQLVTDALVWGGTAETGDNVVFARYPDPPPNDRTDPGDPGAGIPPTTFTADAEQEAIDRQTEWGIWQRAEPRVGQSMYFTELDVFERAYAIVEGDTGQQTRIGGEVTDGGLNQPLQSVQLTWFANDVPGGDHLFAGQVVSMVFYSLGDSESKPLVVSLPLIRATITFPTLPPLELNPGAEPMTYVRFDGEFGVSYTDSRFLWKFLRDRNTATASILVNTSNNNSTQTTTGAYGQFTPLNNPDGVETTFSLPFSYIAGTTQVYLNGLLQRPGYEYVETTPGSGEITFNVAPLADDVIWIVTRTGAA